MRLVKILIASSLCLMTGAYAAEDSKDNVNVSGDWIGTWTSYRSPEYNGTVELTLAQSGDAVTGKAVFTNTRCSPNRTVTGKVLPNSRMIVSQVFAGDTPPKPREKSLSDSWGVVTIANNAISNVYNFVGDGPCKGDAGTWFIAKKQPYKPN